MPKPERRTIRLKLYVTVPPETSECMVEDAINKALDEPPCDWGDWTVSYVEVDE